MFMIVYVWVWHQSIVQYVDEYMRWALPCLKVVTFLIFQMVYTFVVIVLFPGNGHSILFSFYTGLTAVNKIEYGVIYMLKNAFSATDWNI